MKHLAWAILVLFLIPTATADYTHLMGDAGRTATVDAGPDHPDTAWTLDLGGTRPGLQPPLIHDGEVFAPVVRMEGEDPRTDVWRVDLQTGEGGVWLANLAALSFYDDFFVFQMAIGAGQLVVTTGHGLAGYDFDGAGEQPAWTWDARETAAPHLGSDPLAFCAGIAIADGRLVAPCTLVATDPSDEEPRSRTSGSGGGYEALVATFRIDDCNGPCTPAWVWHRDAGSTAPPTAPTGDPVRRVGAANDVPTPLFSIATSTAISGQLAAVSYGDHQTLLEVLHHYSDAPRVNYGYFSVWVLNLDEQELVWDARSSTWGSSAPTDDEVVLPQHEDDYGYLHAPRFSDELLLYTVDRQLHGVGVGVWTGWQYDIGSPTERVGFSANSITVRDQDAWVASMAQLFRIDLDTQEELAQGSASAPGSERKVWLPLSPFLLAGDTMYAASIPAGDARDTMFEGGGHVTVHALGAESLRSQWRLRIDDDSTSRRQTSAAEFAVSDGFMVLQTRGGSLIGIGGPKQVLAAVGPELFPEPGAVVTVEVTEAAEAYLFDWGDGTPMAWSPESAATHAYERAGTYEVWALARSDDGWRSAHWTVEVGGVAPQEPNAIETAFARDNQDLTFGVLGVALALGGGAIAVTSRQRRHGRLQRELAAIDSSAEAAAGNAVRLRAAMEERRAHCHGLLLNHKIEESQFAVLERHIDGIARGQRMDQMRELFDVLPHGIVRALEDALADGRVNAVERQGVLRLVERNAVLTDPQKRQVADLIEAWFAQDEGGGA